MSELEKSSVPETLLIIGHGYFTDLWMTHISFSTIHKHEVVNYSNELTITLQNCGFHKLLLSSEPGTDGKENVMRWEFLEIQKDEHLISTGFACVRN